MTVALLRLTVLAFLFIWAEPVQAQVVAALDAYWAEVSRTVAEGDFEGYSSLYHPDAVMVSDGSQASYSIAQALGGWEPDFLATKQGKSEASVTFRFTQRLHDESTAHETGMFRYTLKTPEGSQTAAIVHFQGLMVKKDGQWLMVMEYQQHAATQSEWDAAH